jgi:CRP/FNR family transcriptional regulator
MSSRGPERLQAVLGTLPMFRELPQPLRARVASMATMQEVAKGDAVWHAGDASDSLTMVVEGRLKIVKHAEAGDVILEMFGPGEVAGVVALYNQIPTPPRRSPWSRRVLLRLPRRDWFDLLERDPAFTRAVLLAMTRLNMALTRKLASMHGTRVQARVATLFLSLADRMGRDTPEGVEIPLALSRQEIAETVGTTVETAIRVMSRWNREGVLLTGRERFVIPDREKLKSAAQVGEDE